MTSGSRLAAYAITGLAVLLAGSSMLPFAWFLFEGPLDLVTLDISEGPALLLNAGLCLAFFAQHTGMIRRSFHRWTATFIAAHYQGTVYTIASGIVLLLLVGDLGSQRPPPQRHRRRRADEDHPAGQHVHFGHRQ